jgi:hypothetical protein
MSANARDKLALSVTCQVVTERPKTLAASAVAACRILLTGSPRLMMIARCRMAGTALLKTWTDQIDVSRRQFRSEARQIAADVLILEDVFDVAMLFVTEGTELLPEIWDRAVKAKRTDSMDL